MSKTESKDLPDLPNDPNKTNWVEKAGGLPDYIKRIAKHLHDEQGHDTGRAIAEAVNTCRRWAAGGTVTPHGGPTVSKATQAKAAAAIAEWEAKAKGSKLAVEFQGERLWLHQDGQVEYDLDLDEARYEQALQLATTVSNAMIAPGSSNRPAVKAIQERLSAMGYPLENDGVFGQATKDALQSFQKKHQLPTDGIVGPKTLSSMLNAKARKPVNLTDPGIDALTSVVAPGAAQTATGTKSLGNIKAALRGGGTAATAAKGTKTPTTGTKSTAPPKGPHGGTIDPTTGAETASASTGPIGSTTPPEPSNYTFEQLHPRGPGGTFATKSGDSGSRVKADQARLNKNGANVKTDGKFGAHTHMATLAFQKSNGLHPDGVIGPKTRTALNRGAVTA